MSSYDGPYVLAKSVRLSHKGREVLSTFASGCHFPTREQKSAMLHQVRETDPEYSIAKLNGWFTHRRQELRKDRRGGFEDVPNTLLDPTTSLAREMWPSLSADALNRLHNMLLEQPHMTVQHKELLASHFGVDIKHVENFINWRVACLGNTHVGWGHVQQHSSPNATGNDDMDIDQFDAQSDSHAHLPTPVGSISPEPVHGKAPVYHAQMHHRPSLLSVDTNIIPSGSGVGRLPTPISTVDPCAQCPQLHVMQGSSNTTPSQLVPCDQCRPAANLFPSPPPSERHSHSKSPPTSFTSLGALPNVLTQEAGPSKPENRQKIRGSEPVTTMRPPLSSQSPARTPRTLRDLDEAYGSTYTRIERFLQNTRRGQYARIGLTPEMLKDIES
ncbi:hypothetical protein B0F90DRAFT_409777 [Multifurca ochricompacta]|uniref:Homeobox domain-containing protein n=1 Tax=Multifurca ochricompacta TaxID=376703 RepID=A0AAD4M5B3_9AGAM|nr:hypothetical protein B0F90DRAFT_409777 [Multifurca ochricompacta]